MPRVATTMMKIGVQWFTVAMLKHCTPIYFRGNLFSHWHSVEKRLPRKYCSAGFQPAGKMSALRFHRCEHRAPCGNPCAM